MITLTSEERFRFAAFLIQEAENNLLLAAQTDRLGVGGMSKVLRDYAVAAQAVAKVLRSTETQKI